MKYLVLGASGGIGSAVSRQLLMDGHRVVLAGRNRDALMSLAACGDGMVHTLDATRFDDVAACVASAIDGGEKLDGAVNCVGSTLLKPAHLTTQSEFEQVIATNLTTAFALVKAMPPALADGGGSIVLFSSAAANIGLGSHEAIAAAKAGVSGLIRSAAATYAAQNIRVNGIAPGLVETPLTEKITRSQMALAASIAMHPLGRIGRAEEIVPLVMWLLSSDSAWVTGQVIGMDGGLSTLKVRSR